MSRERILRRRARFIAAALVAATPAGCARACACLEPAYDPDAHRADSGPAPAVTHVKFNTGDLKGETGILRGKEEVGNLYEIILDSDGTKVSATRDRFDIIPSPP